MKFSVSNEMPSKQSNGCLVIGIFEQQRLSKSGKKIDKESKGALSQLLPLTLGKVGQLSLFHQSLLPSIILAGCGQGELSETQYKEIINKLITLLKETSIKKVSFFLTEIPVKDRDLNWKIQQAILLINTALYSFDQFKTKKSPSIHLKQFTFIVDRELNTAQQALKQACAMTHGIEIIKNLANTPPNICTPAFIAEQAKEFADKHSSVKLTVLNEKQIATLGMGLFLSVSHGSQLPPKFITLEYKGAGKNVKPIVLVGKGITFDTGGNSMKIPPHMIGMKYDMCGAATVLGVLAATVALKLPLNVIGVIPTCENMLGPQGSRPEDVVRSMSGLTVEILNTDAEGRLILADALTYCERFHPDVVIDIATLTGGCFLALGQHASGLMSNHPPLSNDLLQAGEQTSDRVWPLPLWDEYQEALKSDFADLANVPFTDVGARTIIAGCFLQKFAKNFHWAHLDIANTATFTVNGKRGASGRTLALLVQYLINRSQ